MRSPKYLNVVTVSRTEPLSVEYSEIMDSFFFWRNMHHFVKRHKVGTINKEGKIQ